MARQVTDREDLLRDGTALVPRIQLRCTDEERTVEVFAGFRKGAALSLYFDAEPVYHFNSQGALRRAFVEGLLIKAERGKLVAWRPDRSRERVHMVSHPLTADEIERFECELKRRLSKLAESTAANSCDVAGQIPPEGDAYSRLRSWLADFRELVIADSPHVS